MCALCGGGEPDGIRQTDCIRETYLPAAYQVLYVLYFYISTDRLSKKRVRNACSKRRRVHARKSSCVIVRATLTFSFSERFIKSRGRARGSFVPPSSCVRVRGADRRTRARRAVLCHHRHVLGMGVVDFNDIRITDEGGVDGVREALLGVLTAAGQDMSISELLRLFDSDGMHLIDRGEFESAMRRRFGYDGSEEVLMEIFDECDRDGSGRIGYDELYRFVRGKDLGNHKKRNASSLTRNLTLQPKPGTPGHDLNVDRETGQVLEYDLRHTWTPEDLRLEIQTLLIGNQIAPADWFRTWDVDKGGTLSKVEFLSNFRKLFHFGAVRDYQGGTRLCFGHILWEDMVKGTATKVFDQLAGADHVLDITEFEAWLDAGWIGLQKAQERRRHAVLVAPESDKPKKRSSLGGSTSPDSGAPGAAKPLSRNIMIASRALSVASPSSKTLEVAATALQRELTSALLDMHLNARNGYKQKPVGVRKPPRPKANSVVDTSPAPSAAAIFVTGAPACRGASGNGASARVQTAPPRFAHSERATRARRPASASALKHSQRNAAAAAPQEQRVGAAPAADAMVLQSGAASPTQHHQSSSVWPTSQARASPAHSPTKLRGGEVSPTKPPTGELEGGMPSPKEPWQGGGGGSPVVAAWEKPWGWDITGPSRRALRQGKPLQFEPPGRPPRSHHFARPLVNKLKPSREQGIDSVLDGYNEGALISSPPRHSSEGASHVARVKGLLVSSPLSSSTAQLTSNQLFGQPYAQSPGAQRLASSASSPRMRSTSTLGWSSAIGGARSPSRASPARGSRSPGGLGFGLYNEPPRVKEQHSPLLSGTRRGPRGLPQFAPPHTSLSPANFEADRAARRG